MYQHSAGMGVLNTKARYRRLYDQTMHVTPKNGDGAFHISFIYLPSLRKHAHVINCIFYGCKKDNFQVKNGGVFLIFA